MNMPIYLKDTPLSLGGKLKEEWFVLSSDSYTDLLTFNRRYHGKRWKLSEEDREFLKDLESRPTGRVSRGEEAKRRAIDAKSAVQLRMSVPDRGPRMHLSKVPIRILIHSKFKFFLDDLKVPIVPDQYIPVLNMMMRRQYAAYSGLGRTIEMEDYFEKEIRGKLIQLLRSGSWIDHPDHEDLVFLETLLKKIDLGRRKDLKYSSSQSEESADLSEKFTGNLENRVAPTHMDEGAPRSASNLVGKTGKTFADYQRERREG